MMTTEVLMPAMGVTMEEGSVSCWMKKLNEWVAKDEPLFEIITDKSSIVIESPQAGYLVKIVVPEDETVPVGTVLAYLSDTQEYTEVTPQTEEPPRPISPRARKLARSRGISAAELGKIECSDGHDRIDVADIERYLREKASGAAGSKEVVPDAASAAECVPLNNIKRLTGERMSQSNREIPQFHLEGTVGADRLDALRERLKSDGQKISYHTFLMKACALTFIDHPLANASLKGDELIYYKQVNFGIAMRSPRGLVVPVIRNCEQRSLPEIEACFQELVKKSRDNELAPQDLEGGTFTVSSLGSYGVERFTALVVPGQAGILAVGKLAPQPWVNGGQVTIRKALPLTFTFDHRIVDGADGADILRDLIERLEDPQNLIG
jgi:pyruvate dehydrogenase E2 component (dihydrolipoamide acetyltransferase)